MTLGYNSTAEENGFHGLFRAEEKQLLLQEELWLGYNSTAEENGFHGLFRAEEKPLLLLLFGSESLLMGVEDQMDEEILNYFIAFLVPVFSAILSILTRTLKCNKTGGGGVEVHSAVLMFWLGVGAIFVAIGGTKGKIVADILCL